MPESRFAVEVLYDSGTPTAPHWTVSSGYCIGGAHVLTANHAVGPGRILVRFWGGMECPAEIAAHGGEQVDLALLTVTGGVIPDAPRICAAQVDTGRAARIACQGVGYPWWKEDDKPADGPRPRGRAQLVGYVPTAEGSVGGRLTFHVEATPREHPDSGAASVWASVSGTVVFADDGSGDEYAIGVVVMHRRRDGVSALTLEPLSAIDGLEPEVRSLFRAALGATPNSQMRTLGGTAYPDHARPSQQMSARRILAGSLAAILLVTAALWWDAHRDSVADSLSTGPAATATLAGTSSPGDVTRWWVFKDPLPAPGAGESIGLLAARHESAPMAEHTINFTVQGNRHNTVMITDVSARVVERAAPLNGSAYMNKSASDTPALTAGINLDEDHPRARVLDKNKRILGDFYFDTHGFGLAYREIEPVTVTVFARQSLVRFVLVVSYSVDGKLEHAEVPAENGKPFVVSGIPDRLANAFTRSPGGPGTGWTTAGTGRADFQDVTVEVRP
ncbi:hypothetical protein [Kitasatospora griseola]|uniref:hypothetical protein n=1 Tax=Kitasatospora griseola TaxID=2064 RepID=UPI0034167822